MGDSDKKVSNFQQFYGFFVLEPVIFRHNFWLEYVLFVILDLPYSIILERSVYCVCVHCACVCVYAVYENGQSCTSSLNNAPY